jgi:hypothetical protein
MPQDTVSVALSGDVWTLIVSFAGDLPKSVPVKNDATSANSLRVFVMPMNGTDAPTVNENGWPLEPGEVQSFFDAQARGGDGRITAVYAKSVGATVHVGIDVR